MKIEDNSLRTFGVNIIILLILNILIKSIYLFVVEVGVQNELGPSEFGLYWTYFNLISIIQIVADFGLQNYSRQRIPKQRQSADSLFGRTLGTKIILSVFFIVIASLVGLIKGSFGENPFLYVLVLGLILSMSWSMYMRLKVVGLGYYKIDNILSIIDKLIACIIMGGILFFDVLDDLIYYFVVAQMIGYLAVIIWVGSWLKKRFSNIRINFSRKNTIVIVRQVMPYALLVFLMDLLFRFDVVMIDYLLEEGQREAGIYAAAKRILEAANILGVLVSGLLASMFANQIKKRESHESLFSGAFWFLSSVSIVVAIVCWFEGEFIMKALYVHADSYYGEMLSFLMLCFIFRSYDFVVGSLLLAYEKMKLTNILYAAVIGLNIFLNYFFIIEYKALGAVYATAICQGLMIIILYTYTQIKLLKKAWYELLIKPLLFGLIGLGIWYAFNLVDMNILLRIAIFGVCMLLLAYRMRMLPFLEEILEKKLISSND